MQKPTDTKHSISTSVFGIQKLFRQLEEQWPILNPKRDPGLKKQAANDLHALGPVNLDKVRQQFSNHISAIRSICSQFETEVLGDVMKMGAGADPAFRKHFTHLKEQAATESTVLRVNQTLKNVKALLEQSLSQREPSKAKAQTYKLEKLGESMGLVTFVDASQKHFSDTPVTTVTLGGTVIVVDIDVDESGKVLRTKVTYVTEALQNDQDDRVDRLLATNLQTNQFDLFKRNLGTLALMDRFNVQHTPTDFFMIAKALWRDLKNIYNQELLSNDLPGLLMEGHGIPSLYLEYPGVAISYWASKELILGNDWDAVQQAIERDENHASLSRPAKLLISFEESEESHVFLPPSRLQFLLGYDDDDDTISNSENGKHLEITKEPTWPPFMHPMSFIRALPTHPDVHAVPVRFVAILDPPIPASDTVVQKLMRSTVFTGEVPTAETSSSSAHTSTLTLEELLVTGVEGQPVLDSEKSWIVSFKDTPDQAYRWMGTTGTAGKLIQRVPFTHPVQLYSILQLLRRQHMFNKLFTSIFNASTYQDQKSHDIPLSLDEILQASEADRAFHIEVAALDVPNTIHISISLPTSHTKRSTLIPLSIQIPRDNPASPVVKLDPPSSAQHGPIDQPQWHPDVFDQEKMSRVIQTGYSIPLLVRWLWLRIERHNGDVMTYAPKVSLKRRSHLGDEHLSQDKRVKAEYF